MNNAYTITTYFLKITCICKSAAYNKNEVHLIFSGILFYIYTVKVIQSK